MHGHWQCLPAAMFGVVLLCIVSAAYGVDGSGTAYIPNAIDDPTLHSVVISDLDGSGFLRGDAADVSNCLTERANSGTFEFNYDPGGSSKDRVHFAETMAYYHITEYYHYIRRLGFDEITTPVSAVAYSARRFGHLWIPVPSAYDPETRTINLAATTNMMDSDAFDGDVIVHEYAHATQHLLRGGQQGQYVSQETTVSEQGLALMEGLADFAATSRFDDAHWGEWQGAIWQNKPFVRNVDNFHRWPDNFVEAYEYQTAMIFSGALWDLRSVVGREVADTLALKLIQLVPDNDPATPELNTTFLDALDAIVQADAQLYGGAHEQEIRQAFAVHGLGSYGFSTGFPMAPNPGNGADTLEEYNLPGAPALAVTFDEFVTKLDDAGFTKDELPIPNIDEKTTLDYLEILDGSGSVVGTYTGRELQGAMIVVPGDTVQFHLVTDSYREPFGYRVVDITPTVFGDANLDGTVNLSDIVVAIDNWQASGEEATWLNGDVTFDGIVDLRDIAEMIDHWQDSCPAGLMAHGQGPSAVPEPATPALLALGSCLFLLRRRSCTEAGNPAAETYAPYSKHCE